MDFFETTFLYLAKYLKMDFAKKHAFPLVLFFVAVVAAFFIIPYSTEIALWAFPSNPDRNGELVKVGLSIAGGLFVLYGLYISYLRARAAEQAVEKQTLVIANQSNEIELSRESMTNDQFKTAVEHLGSDKEPIILGGVVELNELAVKFPSKFSTVVANIFTSYIRSEAPAEKEDGIRWAVISAIIDNLCHTKAYEGVPVNLERVNISGVHLQGCSLSHWNLSGSKLPVNMTRVKFSDSYFSSAKANHSRYDFVDFESCIMYKFVVDEGEWHDCKFLKADGKNVQIYAADSKFYFSQFPADMLYPVFCHCEISSCDFGEKDLIGIRFYASNLKHITFKNKMILDGNFNASSFWKVSFKCESVSLTIKGASALTDDYLSGGLRKRLEERINKRSDISGTNLTKNIEVPSELDLFTCKDAQEIAEVYNKIIKEGWHQNKEITLNCNENATAEV